MVWAPDDIYPTLVELASLKSPTGLDGESLAPLLNIPEGPGRTASYSEVLRTGVHTRIGSIRIGPLRRSLPFSKNRKSSARVEDREHTRHVSIHYGDRLGSAASECAHQLHAPPIRSVDSAFIH